MVRAVLFKTFEWLRGLAPHLTAIARCQTQTPEATRREMGQLLLAQLRYFGQRADALPEWRAAAKIRDVDELWRVWPSLPCITKRDLQTRFEPHEIQRRFGIPGIISSTGGSTGEPTPYLHDRASLPAHISKAYFARLQFGWTPGMATLCLWGSERDINKQRSWQRRVSSFLKNEWLIDGYGLDQVTVDTTLQHIRRHRAVALFGFTSMLEFVAREIVDRKLSVPPGAVRTAWNGGEMLFASQAELFQRAFGAPLYNFYGGREFGAMAYEAQGSRSLQVLRPWLFVEIVDEHNRPVPPGETGRLLCTNTVCRGTPFLRYDVGDIACSSAADQDVSGIRALTELQGRSAGLLRLPNRKTINCLFWNHLFKEFNEVQQFQVVNIRDSQLLLNLKGTRWTVEREHEVRRILDRLLGDVPVTVNWVDRIPLTAQGKLVQVVRQP